jgi:DNA (cytosine-5)-methyltransferase 1
MSDTSTRSGMLWEVERILQECKDLGTLPQVLLMENVPQVHGADNVNDFNKWQLRLEEFGYNNYWQDLIATDYGIPQTRNRTFMVSILGDYSYTFPKPIPLKLKLKDMLEDVVDEKYYLSDKQLQDIQQWNAYQKPLETMEQIDKENISPTITTRSGAYAAGMILVKNATKQGYLEAEEGDGVDISGRMEYHRGTVQKGKIQTINTNQDYGVVVLGGIGEKKSNNNTQWYMQDRIYDNKVGISLATTANPNYVDKQLRIRKLTTREAFRLMGVKDEDYDKVCKNQNENSLFHLAGDSIVVNVLEAIFKEML